MVPLFALFILIPLAAWSADPTPSPTPRAKPQPTARWIEDHKKSCERYYTGKIQAGIRRACLLGGSLVDQYLEQPARIAETGCRLQYGEEPGETFACLIGTKIARELQAGTKNFMALLQLCAESYPVRTELDSYLLESCLTGLHAGSLAAPVTLQAGATDVCSSISPERSFVGPCRVGASLTSAMNAGAAAAATHRPLCEKYFDHLRFHLGYRTCLNAQTISLAEIDGKASVFDQLKKRCDAIVSDQGNDHERGACVIGATLFEVRRTSGVTSLFDACGANQARYEDRDILGCLTAASYLSFASKTKPLADAEKFCKEIFRDKKSPARSGCLSSIATLTKQQQGAPPQPTAPSQE